METTVLKPIYSDKMRISFDLDEVLFVNPSTHLTEPQLPFPLRKIFKERLRLGTVSLIHRLQSEGFEVWVYTTSYRSETYIRRLFASYHVRFDGIVNAQRHLKEVQGNRKEILPQKMPTRYRISLHIDDETVVCTYGKYYGFNVYQLNAQDDEWADKIMQRVYEIKKAERREYADDLA